MTIGGAVPKRWPPRRWRRAATRLHCAVTAACVTGKRSYATEADARGALLSTRVRAVIDDNPRRREKRCYVCPKCGYWHLASGAG